MRLPRSAGPPGGMTSTEGRPTSPGGLAVARCQSGNHPQVPQTVCSITITFCHNCQAWKVYGAGYTQLADDDQQTFMSVERNFGPFDDVGQVLLEADHLMTEWMLSAGRPWDPSQRNPITGIRPRDALYWDDPG